MEDVSAALGEDGADVRKPPYSRGAPDPATELPAKARSERPGEEVTARFRAAGDVCVVAFDATGVPDHHASSDAITRKP